MLVIHQSSSLPRGTNAKDLSRQYMEITIALYQ